jgi:hypothetical protein
VEFMLRSCSRFVSCMSLLVSLAPMPGRADDPPDPCVEPAACAVDYGYARIAVDADGNFNDDDDWASTPMTLAILAAGGLQDRVVHYTFNNSLGANDPEWQQIMGDSALDGARLSGFDIDRFYNAQQQLEAGIANLREHAARSTPDDPLFILAMGPMEFLWRALSEVDPEALRHVTVISHSPWNDNRKWLPTAHDAEDIKALGVTWLQITEQNEGLNTRENFLPWSWLSGAEGYLGWVYERMLLTRRGDVSDAGMAYFLLTGDPYTTPDKLKQFLRP